MTFTNGFGFKELLSLLRAASQNLEMNVEVVNALNVYPVPDGDTGTNMHLTLKSTLEELDKVKPQNMSQFAEAVVRGSLMGARGNSGVILSQLFRGFCKSLDKKESINQKDMAEAIEEAVKAAYQAVMRPVEGTMLTVAREISQAALSNKGSSWETFFSACLQAGQASLAKTPDLLPILKEAGVVDAGGQGLLYLLEGVDSYLQGKELKGASSPLLLNKVEESLQYRYDLQFLLKRERLSPEAIQETLRELGDSLLVVGFSPLVRVHIHTNHPLQVLEKSSSFGLLDKVAMEDMQEQQQDFIKKKNEKSKALALVAVCCGSGFEEIFSNLGASSIIRGGQSMNPSCGEILEAVEGLESQEVILLPNNPNIFAASLQAKALAKKRIAVVPTRNLPQGISASLVFSPFKSLEENVKAMEKAILKVTCGEVTYATRDGSLNGMNFSKNTVIGLIDSKLNLSGDDPIEVCFHLIKRMLTSRPNALSLGIFRGEETLEDDAQKLVEMVAEEFPHCEIDLQYGGQPFYYYIVSLE